ncbi:MAG TPA: hypothetical protein VMR98_02245 [Candidatus Polarisedimenticolaceae bacterium]|nr:hypothetical protein [Candidatus Polarisedimenticolaceae bacterium]
MARGWHGDSAGHARAGRMGGRKSAETRKRTHTEHFGEQLQSSGNKQKAGDKAKSGKAG